MQRTRTVMPNPGRRRLLGLNRRGQSTPLRLVARIDHACLAVRRVECRVCGENCETRAIRFVLAPGRMAQPAVDAERCTGCGACASLCPAAAIRMEQDLTEAKTA
jgi:ferredoxin-type protein NapF